MSNSNALLEKESREVDLLHEIGSRIAAADPLHELLAKVLDFISIVAKFDSCFSTYSRTTNSSSARRKIPTPKPSIA